MSIIITFGFMEIPEIYRALNFIYDHIYLDISLENLAACSGLSVSQFKVRFKQEVGISPRSFINMQKVEAAKSMLPEGLSKTETALQLGFNTSSYFAAVFKKYTFYTPSEYVRSKNKTDKSPSDIARHSSDNQ